MDNTGLTLICSGGLLGLVDVIYMRITRFNPGKENNALRFFWTSGILGASIGLIIGGLVFYH